MKTARETAAFVLCIEGNEIERQSLLLAESIRRFGGRWAASEIFAVAPRAGLGVGDATRTRLDQLEVTYHEEALNVAAPWYASANRLAAGAWAAGRSTAEVLFVLDSDTLVLGELDAPGDGCDLAVRPVDVKGAASSGPEDPADAYWQAFAALAGLDLAALPWVETVLDRVRVRATYNGGFAAVRRTSGIVERAQELFVRAHSAGLRPTAGNSPRVVASTGAVSSLASSLWGSNQAALSLAAWSTSRRVEELDRRTNLPLHGLADPTLWDESWRDLRPLHVHYHWMLEPAQQAHAMAVLSRVGVPAEQREWIARRSTELATSARAKTSRSPRRVAAPSRQLLVCGMHRSGTSLVASALERSGLAIGDELNPGGVGNPRGHFEDAEIHRLHEAWLAAAGETWLTAGAELKQPPAGIEARARRYVERRSQLPLWGFKDPRACLALGFWDGLLPQPSYLLLYRHPVDVALSLWRRGGDPELRRDPWLAIRSWECHNRLLLELRERHPRRTFLAQVPAVASDLALLVEQLNRRFGLALNPQGVGEVLAAGELAPRLSDELAPGWSELIGGATALYERLEASADLPGRTGGAPAAVTPATDTRTSEALLFALLEKCAIAASAPRLSNREHELALASELARVTTRRDELARVLEEIESSRAHRAVRAVWELRRRLRGGASRKR